MWRNLRLGAKFANFKIIKIEKKNLYKIITPLIQVQFDLVNFPNLQYFEILIRLKVHNDRRITMTRRLTRLSSSNHGILFALSKSMRDRVVASRNYDTTQIDECMAAYFVSTRRHIAFAITRFSNWSSTMRLDVSTLLVAIISNTNQSYNVCSSI